MTLLGILVLSFLLVVGVVAVIRFAQFWFGFAEGINEANGEPRGFEVKLSAGEEPVTKQKENDHG